MQRIKVGFGSDAVLRDVDASNGMPVSVVSAPDVLVTGTITTTDIVVGAPAGTGLVVSGTSTAGSYVAAQSWGGDTAWTALVTGLTTGTLYFEESVNSTTGIDGSWIAVNGRQTGVVNTVLTNNATANGVYRGNTSGVGWWRIRSVGALTGTPAVTVRLSDGVGAVFLNASIPAGTNMIGTVGPQPSTTGALTTASLSLTSFTVLAANTARKTAMVANDSANLVYLALAAAASTSAYTIRLDSGGYYELPGTNAVYTGIITGIALVASGTLNVTELT